MREILFRGKRTDNGEWVEGYIVRSRENTYPNGFEMITKEGINYDELDYFNPDFVSYEVDESTICQYTGLTDKNGQKIWENDIVKSFNSQGQECYIEKIVWADYGLNEGWCSKGIRSLIKYDKRVFDTGFGKLDARKCEVIGNIFDNANLVKE